MANNQDKGKNPGSLDHSNSAPLPANSPVSTIENNPSEKRRNEIGRFSYDENGKVNGVFIEYLECTDSND
jgi:hypothetical protein